MPTIVPRTGPARFGGGSGGKQQASERFGTGRWRSWVWGRTTAGRTGTETRTEDAGLPEHERDESRQSEGTTSEDDAAEVANMSDSGLSEEGLPAHEDDSRRTEDTGSGEQNP